MKSILVTGATQPLGRAVIDELMRNSVDTIVATGLEADPQLPKSVHYEAADLSHSRQIRRLMLGICREHEIDCIIHLAFHRNPGGRRAERLHVEGTRLLMRLAEEHPSVTHFVHLSSAEVYAARRDRPDLVREDNPLNFAPSAPTWIRHIVEADLTLCSRMGMAKVSVAVLRCTEILAPGTGSQLHDYLDAPLCLRPMGFDPIINILSLHDAARALVLAAIGKHSGVFNIRGHDTLTLSDLIRLRGRTPIPLPGPFIAPFYRARGTLFHKHFRYELNHWRFHFNSVLDGSRAERLLGYTPQHGIDQPTLKST